MKLMEMDMAVELVKDGVSIAVSGMTFYRNPSAFIFALAKSGRKDLFFIDREPGFALEFMIKSKLVNRVRASMATLEWFGIPPSFRKSIEAGEVDFLEDTCGAFMAGIRAGAFGLPFMPVKGILGSDLVELHEKRGSWKRIVDPFNRDEMLLVKAIVPDVAVIHCNRADRKGNADIEGPHYEDEYKAKAANTVIITAEEIVGDDYFKGKRPVISEEYVSAVVAAPNGAKPTGMYGLYEPDFDKIWELLFG